MSELLPLSHWLDLNSILSNILYVCMYVCIYSFLSNRQATTLTVGVVMQIYNDFVLKVHWFPRTNIPGTGNGVIHYSFIHYSRKCIMIRLIEM